MNDVKIKEEKHGCWWRMTAECPICHKGFSVQTKTRGFSKLFILGQIKRHNKKYHFLGVPVIQERPGA
jgi:hypothetical protein